ncbi:MAG: hydantoinase/oxoprolinase family protein, partial [Salinirussus sp.]
TVIIPRSPGVFSARGLLIADVRIDESQAYAGQEIDVEQLRTQFDALEAVLADRFSEQGFSPDETEISRSIDVRYDGQAYELTVPVDGGVIDQPTVEAVESRFHEQHARRYGHAMQDEPIEFVTLRVEGTVPTASMRDEPRETTSDAQVGEREVYFDGAVQTAAIYDRRALGQGTSIDGPAILEESGSTTALPPGAVGTVTDAGSIRIDLGEGE